ncbi:DgyrCDS12350 [Dimorphilus gyrociliatus]|uniref:DgyrCDS12350 n=1 Tax=Dimorphilus gyrociliatus TaxID=2664684 RepID=A0A7I8W8J5_9ANNE|nr:DgyrCDS12350 [Dimorphilus gyrociliatus]
MASKIDSMEEEDGEQLFLACREGNLKKVSKILKEGGVDPNAKNIIGHTALHVACHKGYKDIVEELLRNKADIELQTLDGFTPLHIASRYGKLEVIKVLVEHNAKINCQSNEGFTPIYLAAEENFPDMITYLLSKGAKPQLTTKNGFRPLDVAVTQKNIEATNTLLTWDKMSKKSRHTALHSASRKNDRPAAALLIETGRCSINDKTPNGFTALHIACQYNSTDILEYLIENGANINIEAKNKVTPLHVASKCNKLESVIILLDNGANMEVITTDKLTPLHCASRSGQVAIVEKLLERGAEVNAKSKSKLTPLHMASQGNHYDCARLLIYHKAPVEDVAIDYLTALHVASHCGSYETAKLLLSCNCKVDPRARNGFTPLHIACKKERIRIIELLLSYGAVINATAESGLTALHVAAWYGFNEIVKKLIDKGADPNAKTRIGQTPLHTAVIGGKLQTVKLLIKLGSQINAKANQGETPLHLSADLGDWKAAECLLKGGAAVDEKMDNEFTPLHVAIRRGQVDTIKILLKYHSNPELKTSTKLTALHLAAKMGNPRVIELLLKKGADPNSRGVNELTPLHVACHYRKAKAIQLLLDKDAKVNLKAKNGMQALHIAAKRGYPSIVNQLLKRKADPNASTRTEYRPLHYSSVEGNTNVTKLLIKSGADPNCRSRNGLTPLHLCAEKDETESGELLINSGSKLEEKSNAGFTPLHTACYYGSIGMIKLLLKHGSNFEASTELDYSPLHLAAQQGNALTINILLQKGADANRINKDGQTALSIARKCSYVSIAEGLKDKTDVVVKESNVSYTPHMPDTMEEDTHSEIDSEDESTFITTNNQQLETFMTYTEEQITADVCTMENAAIFENGLESERTISEFLISFIADANGAIMVCKRYSGLRIIVQPNVISNPTKFILKFVKKDQLSSPPPLLQNEGLACRILELSPNALDFDGEIIIEVPHFASLEDGQREIAVLRSDNGVDWIEHKNISEERRPKNIDEIFKGFREAESVYNRNVVRIKTNSLPKYFALVSLLRQRTKLLGQEGGILVAHAESNVQINFPKGAVTKTIQAGIQAQIIKRALLDQCLKPGVISSPIVSLEPSKRKFHREITISLPLGTTKLDSKQLESVRLFCSLDERNVKWEDITGTTEITYSKNCAHFKTIYPGKFWILIDNGFNHDLINRLYNRISSIPYLVNFVCFSKRFSKYRGQLRLFCISDDKLDKTLEGQENFEKIVTSKLIEVGEGWEIGVEVSENFEIVSKSKEGIAMAFRPFVENRLSINLRIRDYRKKDEGFINLVKKSNKKSSIKEIICTLPIHFPLSNEFSDSDSDNNIEKEIDEENNVIDNLDESINNIGIEDVQQALTGTTEPNIKSSNKLNLDELDLKLTDIAGSLGDDWEKLAYRLNSDNAEIKNIQASYDYHGEKALVYFHYLLSVDPPVTGKEFVKALKKIGREDVIIDYITDLELKSLAYEENEKEEEEEEKEEKEKDTPINDLNNRNDELEEEEFFPEINNVKPPIKIENDDNLPKMSYVDALNFIADQLGDCEIKSLLYPEFDQEHETLEENFKEQFSEPKEAIINNLQLPDNTLAEKDPFEEEKIDINDLKLTKIADKLGSDWQKLATHFDLTKEDIDEIKTYDSEVESAMICIQTIAEKIGLSEGKQIEKALSVIGREDIIRKYVRTKSGNFQKDYYGEFEDDSDDSDSIDYRRTLSVITEMTEPNNSFDNEEFGLDNEILENKGGILESVKFNKSTLKMQENTEESNGENCSVNQEDDLSTSHDYSQPSESEIKDVDEKIHENKNDKDRTLTRTTFSYEDDTEKANSINNPYYDSNEEIDSNDSEEDNNLDISSNETHCKIPISRELSIENYEKPLIDQEQESSNDHSENAIVQLEKENIETEDNFCNNIKSKNGSIDSYEVLSNKDEREIENSRNSAEDKRNISIELDDQLQSSNEIDNSNMNKNELPLSDPGDLLSELKESSNNSITSEELAPHYENNHQLSGTETKDNNFNESRELITDVLDNDHNNEEKLDENTCEKDQLGDSYKLTESPSVTEDLSKSDRENEKENIPNLEEPKESLQSPLITTFEDYSDNNKIRLAEELSEKGIDKSKEALRKDEIVEEEEERDEKISHLSQEDHNIDPQREDHANKDNIEEEYALKQPNTIETCQEDTNLETQHQMTVEEELQQSNFDDIDERSNVISEELEKDEEAEKEQEITEKKFGDTNTELVLVKERDEEEKDIQEKEVEYEGKMFLDTKVYTEEKPENEINKDLPSEYNSSIEEDNFLDKLDENIEETQNSSNDINNKLMSCDKL